MEPIKSVNSPFSVTLFEYIKQQTSIDDLADELKAFDENESLIPTEFTTQDLKQLRLFLYANTLADLNLTGDLSIEIAASIERSVISGDLWKRFIVELVASVNPKQADMTLKFMHRLPQLKSLNLHDRVMNIWRITKKDLFQLIKTSEYQFFVRTWSSFEQFEDVHNVADLVTVLLDVGKVEFTVPKKQKVQYKAVLTDALDSELFSPIVTESLRKRLIHETDQQCFKLDGIYWMPPGSVKDDLFSDISSTIKAFELLRPLQQKWFGWLNTLNITDSPQGVEWTKRFKSAFIQSSLTYLQRNKQLLSDNQYQLFQTILNIGAQGAVEASLLIKHFEFLRKNSAKNFDALLFVDVLIRCDRIEGAFKELSNSLQGSLVTSNHLALMSVMFVKTGHLDTAVSLFKKACLLEPEFLKKIRENNGFYEATKLLTKAERKRLRTPLKEILESLPEHGNVSEQPAQTAPKNPPSRRRVVNNENDKAVLVDNEKNIEPKKPVNSTTSEQSPKVQKPKKKRKPRPKKPKNQQVEKGNPEGKVSVVANLLKSGGSVKPL